MVRSLPTLHSTVWYSTSRSYWQKHPGGSSKLASYAAALFLLKENFNISDTNMQKIVKGCDVDVLDLIQEATGAWYLLDDGQLSTGHISCP